MNQYAVLIYANDSAHDPDATPADIEDCDRHADALVAASAMRFAFALTPRAHARAVRSGGSVTKGPLLSTKDIVAGLYIIEAADMDAAVRIAATNPVVRDGGGVEVRPVHSGGTVAASS